MLSLEPITISTITTINVPSLSLLALATLAILIGATATVVVNIRVVILKPCHQVGGFVRRCLT